MDVRSIIYKTCTMAACGFLSGYASAASVTFNLDIEFGGAQQPQGPTPWITAVVDDSFGDANTVRLTMNATNLVGSESIANWFFNFSGDATQLTFTGVDTADATVNEILTDNTGSDANLKPAGDGFFDFGFDFAPPPGTSPARFTAGETMVYDISYIAAITAADFDLFSTPGPGQAEKQPYLSAAHILQITDPVYCDGSTPDLTGDCGSGWIGAVPVPAAVWLFGSGLLGLVAVARRRRS
ncbi:MAG: VPLPA-CTERM sorting domain-containing protein [Thiotrichales bacterium]|nr:MAG: VPLPA-CTERM sorting domain-containing protein [Thiotrichales bacterium]